MITPSSKPNKEPLFILSFLKRYWKLLALFVGFVILSRYDRATFAFGPLFYLFMIGIGIAVAVFLLKNIMFKHTLDKFTHDANGQPSEFVTVWNALPGPEKLRYTMITLWVMFGGMCIVAASIAK